MSDASSAGTSTRVPLRRTCLVVLLVVVALAPVASVGVAQSDGTVDVSGLDPTSTTVTSGGSTTVAADVTNTGGTEVDQSLELVADPGGDETVLATEDVTLAAGASDSVTFDGVTVDRPAGTYDYVVRSDDDASQTGTLTVDAPANFAVQVDDGGTDDAVDAGANLTVAATVTNEGDVTDAQTVTLEVDGSAVDTTSVTLADGESETVTLAYGTDRDDAPGVDATVRSDDDFDTTRTAVRATNFELAVDDGRTATDVVAGENATVAVDVTNVGELAGTQTLAFEMDGTTVTRDVTLDVDETDTVAVSAFETAVGDGSLAATVESRDDEVTTDVTVRDPASFAVALAGTRVESGTATVEATVTNEGDLTATQSVAFEVDGRRVSTTDVTLTGGERQRVTFVHDLADPAGGADATVRSDDDFVTRTLAAADVEAGPTVVDVVPETVQSDDAVTVTYTAAGDAVRAVDLVVLGPDGTVVSDQSVDAGRNVSTDLPTSVPASDEGRYDVRLRVTDRAGRTATTTARDAFTVDAAFSPNRATFGRDVYRAPAGDLVQVSLTLPKGDAAYVVVGGDRASDESSLNNFLDVLYVKGAGSATFTVNTRLVGTNVSSERAYTASRGTVVSYAQTYGPDTHPDDTVEFQGLSFVDEDGDRVAATLSEFRDRVGVSSLPRPLHPARYRLVAGAEPTLLVREDGIPDVANPVARTNLLLTDPELGSVTTYVLPRGSANELTYGRANSNPVDSDTIDSLVGSATRRNAVARGDRLLLEVEATGLYGALLATTGESAALGDADGSPVIHRGVGPETVADLLRREEGVSIRLRQTNPGTNRPATTVDFERAVAGDVYLVPETVPDATDSPATERFYLVLDTREDTLFTKALSGGDEFRFEVVYESPRGGEYHFREGPLPEPFAPDPAVSDEGTEFYPYAAGGDTNETTGSTFRVEDPTVTYDARTIHGNPIVVGSADATLSGTTNVAPGSDVTIQLVSGEETPPETVTIDDVTVDEDGTFSVAHDLSMLSPGDDVEVEFYVYEQLLDKRSGVVLDAADTPARFTVSDLTESVTVRRGHGLGAVTATVTNTGAVAGRHAITLRLDGETVVERRAVLDQNESTSVAFDDVVADRPPGEYRYTLVTPHDEATGTLVVAGENDTATAAATPTNGTAPTTELTSVGDRPNEESDPAGVPLSRPLGLLGLGVAARDALGGVAVVGSVYLLGARA